MLKNRFFKSLFGVKIEALIARALDTSNAETPSIPGTAGTATYSATVAGTPTAGDQIILTFGSKEFHYEVASGDTTAATFGTSILAYLNAEQFSVANSLVWTKAGTTSLVLTATGPTGTLLNGTVTGTRAGSVNAGPTFSGMSSTTYTGGVNAVADQAIDYEAFIANAAAGALGVYFDEHTSGAKGNPAVLIGDTAKPANANRRMFWAVKDGAGNAFRTSSFPLAGLKYGTAPYAAGTNQVSTITCVTKPAAGQVVHVRITNTTIGNVPYPTYEYTAIIPGTATAANVETALGLIATAINAETQDPIVTASASSDNSMVLTITGVNGTITFKTSVYAETNATTTSDGSTWTMAVTTPPIAPVGTPADIAEFEKYFIVASGAVLYPQAGTLQSEWNSFVSNIVSGTQYGYFIASVNAVETPEGSTRRYHDKKRVVIALPTASLALLASF